MGYLVMEGFDLVGSNDDLLRKGFTTADGLVTAGEGRFGGNAYEMTATDSGLTFPSPFAQYSTVSFWFKSDLSSSGDTELLGIRGTSSGLGFATGFPEQHLRIRLSPNGVMGIDAFDSLPTGPLFVETAVGFIEPNVWYHFEVQSVLQQIGTCVIFIDGVDSLDIEAELRNDGFPGYNFSSFTVGDDNVNKNALLIDDLVVQTSDFILPPLLGEHKIHTLLPDSDTATADWTGSYTDVDDPLFASSDGDATYLSSSVVDQSSEVTFQSLSEAPDTIYAIQAIVETRKDDTGARTLIPYIVSDIYKLTLATGAPMTAYTSYVHSLEFDPHINYLWTEASVNRVTLGITLG